MRRLLPLLFLSGCALAPVKTPDELAVYTNCEPERIAYWIDNRIEYHEQGAYWLPAGASMTLERGDCKAKATIAKDTLNRCIGYEAWVKIIKNGEKFHAITIFEDHKRQRGFINSGQMMIYAPGYPWEKIIKDVNGGPWEDYR